MLTNAYWNVSEQILSYAPDEFTAFEISLGGVAVATINCDVFFDKIYAPRHVEGLEDRIIDVILGAPALICLIGPRGCGKSSTLYYVVRALREKRPATRVELFDVKVLYDNLPHDLTRENAARTFRQMLRENLNARLFRTPQEIRPLIAWLLAGPPDESDPFNPAAITDLADASMVALSRVNCDSDKRAERVLALSQWFLEKPVEYSNQLATLLPRLRAAHFVQGALRLGKIYPQFTRSAQPIDKFVLIYDNVDRIPAEFQPTFFEVISDKHLNLAGACTTVVGIRRENLKGESPHPNSGGDVFVAVEPGVLKYPAYLIPPDPGNHVKDILQRRHQYVLTLIRANIEGSANSWYESMHSAVIGEFIDNSIAPLANYSIRMIGALYVGFLEFLVRLSSHGLLPADTTVDKILAAEEKYLQTLFFLFLRAKGDEYDIMLYDVLKEKGIDDFGDSFASMASEHHLLITCVLNLSRSTAVTRPWRDDPFVGTVVEYMRDLGFDEKMVTMALRDLVGDPGEQLRILELRDVRPPWTAADLPASARVRLTPMGTELITKIFHKVGYVWGSVYAHASLDRTYLELQRKERVRLFYAHVVGMAKRHLTLMTRLRAMWPSVNDWLGTYRTKFGVEGELQVERIAGAAAGFYRSSFDESSNPFTMLKLAHTSLLDKLARGLDLHEDDLSEFNRGRALIDKRFHK